MTTEEWTLDELAQRAGAALAADAVHAPNGRVRERPDGRAIRWYATIGLVDRPSTGRGRAAKYGEHHLLQLVAVKRLQALGRSLAEIQIELAGATEATLRRIADLPEETDEEFDEMVYADDADTAAPAGFDISVVEDEPAEASAAQSAARFWTARPTQPDIDIAAPPTGRVLTSMAKPAPEPAHEGEPAAVRYEIALSGVVSLTIPTPPSAADLAAVREAAAPLLALLANRGLTTVQGVQDEY